LKKNSYYLQTKIRKNKQPIPDLKKNTNTIKPIANLTNDVKYFFGVSFTYNYNICGRGDNFEAT